MQKIGDLGKPIAHGGTATLYAYGEGAVLKLYREGFPADEAAREAENARAAFAAGARTPAVRETLRIDGRCGVVFDRVDGPPMMAVMFATPEKAFESMAQMAELHAELHSRSCPQATPLRKRWADKIHEAGLPDDLRDFALVRLAELCDAAPEGDALCHGDFHPLNILLPGGDPARATIVDWVDATSGPPLADVARANLILRHAVLPGDLPKPSLDWLARERHALTDAYLDAYHALRPFDRTELAAWLPVVAAARRSDRIPESESETMTQIIGSSGLAYSGSDAPPCSTEDRLP